MLRSAAELKIQNMFGWAQVDCFTEGFFSVFYQGKKVTLGNHVENSLWLLLSGADSRGDCFGERPEGWEGANLIERA